MGFMKTCCGFYCSMTALVGLYFFIILAVMEYRGNAYLVQIVQNIEDENEPQIDHKMKGTAFIICAAVQAVLVGVFYFMGTSSLREEQ